MADQAPPTLEGLQRQLLELQISSLREEVSDHEKRLRLLEDTATKFNFLLYLTMGGGIVSLFTLFSVGALIIKGS